MTGVVAASLIFYSLIENKKESKFLNLLISLIPLNPLDLFFGIDLFVFIEYFAALLAIKEINSFDFDDWILFSLVFLIVFIVILINAPKIKSIFLSVFSKIKLKDHSESTATEEPKGQLESEAKELPETKFKGMTKEEDKFLNKNEIINLSEAKELLGTKFKFKGMTKEEKEEFLKKVDSYIKPPK